MKERDGMRLCGLSITCPLKKLTEYKEGISILNVQVHAPISNFQTAGNLTPGSDNMNLCLGSSATKMLEFQIQVVSGSSPPV